MGKPGEFIFYGSNPTSDRTSQIKPMPRYFLELAYKGTAYSGFQIQENANTIQTELTKALEIIFRQAIDLTGSSRTDAGVHAKQNFFHFDTDKEIHSDIAYNINALLPNDISAKGIYRVPDDAHCRFDAVSREYAYFIYRRKNPFMTDRGWHYPFNIDFSLLQEAAHILMEYTDFTSFAKRNTQVKSFLCTIMLSEWRIEDGVFIYQVKANRFLRGMVRGLVGTMVKRARKLITVEEFRKIIEEKDCTRADFTTPAQGLFLQKVEYNTSLTAFLKPKE